ncbi:hypothetical protein T06_15141, partial [Trichinella sp. T6]
MVTGGVECLVVLCLWVSQLEAIVCDHSELRLEEFKIFSTVIDIKLHSRRASLNSSASHLFQTPPPFFDWLYANRLHAIDRFFKDWIWCLLSFIALRNYNNK